MTTATTSTPTIHLFTNVVSTDTDINSDEQEQETFALVQLYRDFLHKQGHHDLTEINLAMEPALHDDLRRRFPSMFLPGILLNDTVWVHGTDTRDLQAAWGKAWFDHVLHAQDQIDDQDDDNVVIEDDHEKREEEKEEEESLQYVPVPLQSTVPPTTQQLLHESLLSATSQSLYTSHSVSSQLVNVPLPNGTQVEMGALIRLLMRATHHSTAERDGNRFFYFRGFEGMELWSILFFEDHHADVTEFGRMLIEMGIVHNYTPKCTDFAKTFLVLQPLKEPRVLNSFIQWPSGSGDNRTTINPNMEETDPMDVLLRLSRLMDEICATDYRANLHLYHEFEIGCCQLQALPLPSDQRERVTYLLNLYNMAVRHAVICCDERQWSWPTDLESLHAFFRKTGYNIDGTWVSLAELQTVLYGNTEIVVPPLVSEPVGFWKRWSFCRSGDAASAVNMSSQHYAHSTIQTDSRLLFAMTLGIKASPSVATVYPHRLEEGLQTAAEVYAREHLTITNQGVILPALTSWFRHDLGDGTAKMVLHYLLPFLSVEQMRALDELWQRDILEVKFGHSDDDWKTGLNTLISPPSSSKPGNKQGDTPSPLTKEEVSVPEQAQNEISVTPKSLLGIRKKSVSAVEEFSLSPAPELLDPASDIIDPAPLLSPRSTASSHNHNHNQQQSTKSFARQTSFHQKPGVLLRRLWGRYPSVGDFGLRRPGTVDKTETHYDDDDYDDVDSMDDGALSEDGHSFFQSVVSEITYGSEFQDLLSRRSKRRLQAGRR